MSVNFDTDKAIYAQDLHENVCYGIQTTRAEVNLHEDEHNETQTTIAGFNLDKDERGTANPDSEVGIKSQSCNRMVFVFALVLLMCAFSLCIGIVGLVQISRLNSKLASIQKSISLSNQTTERTAFQEALAHINYSIQMRFSQDLSSMESQTMALIQSYTERSDFYIQQLTDELQSLGLLPSHPASSCAAIQEFAPSPLSGHYWIKSSNGSAVRVYCDMTRSCGGVTGGWMRVAELDMRNNSSQCPSTLRMGTACNPTRTCVINSDNANCSSVSFTTHGFNYSRVCGMIRAYQVGGPDAFDNHGNLRNSPTLDSNYVDGISLTHGVSPRQHIWTFAADSGNYS